MRVRVILNGYVDVDVLHPTFADMLDPMKPEREDIADREYMALDGYLIMLVGRAIGAGDEVKSWEVESVESICRVCSCTETNACAGGCSWVEADLCSVCQTKAKAAP